MKNKIDEHIYNQNYVKVYLVEPEKVKKSFTVKNKS